MATYVHIYHQIGGAFRVYEEHNSNSSGTSIVNINFATSKNAVLWARKAGYIPWMFDPDTRTRYRLMYL